MAILTTILNSLIVLISLFMICLILIQRGKGGGLAGAFGGSGSSSAFGSKSGDVFTRVTMYVAIVWIVLSMLLVILYNKSNKSAFEDDASPAVSKEKNAKSKTKVKASTSGAPATGADSGAGVVVPGDKPATATDVPAIPDSTAPVTMPATAPSTVPAPTAPAPAVPAPAAPK